MSLAAAVRAAGPLWALCSGLVAGAAAGQVATPSQTSPPAALPPADFLYGAQGAYRNHAFVDYQLPDFTRYARVNHYGPLGDYLITGYDAYSWTETRTDEPTATPRSLRLVPRWNRFERNVVASDAYKGWSGSLIVGDEIRTLFTPLTLRLVGFDGVRLDAAREPVRVAAIAQRFVGPVPGGTYGQVSTWGQWPTAAERRDAALLLGGHGDARLGALTVGATGVNFHLTDAEQARFELRGQLQSDQALPSFLVVRFADDSPGDERAGAVVNDVRLVVDGRERPDLRPFVVRLDRGNPTAVGTTNRLTGQFRRLGYNDGGTRFADVFYLQRHLEGEDVSGSVNLVELERWVRLEPPGQWRADGDEAVLLFYDLRGEAHVGSARVMALVGNDYHAEVVGVYEDQPGDLAPEQKWRVGGIGDRRQAAGNVQDLSNLDWVELTPGQWTGRSLWGVNGTWEVGDARVTWEVARSVEFSQYPDGRPGHRLERQTSGMRPWAGDRHRRGADAYYLTLAWSAGAWAAGAEAFSTATDFDGGFVEDNDDNDRYPDIGAGHRPVIFWTSPNYDPDGVFTGKDEDHDGVPDTNRNRNELPDYAEPFLRFDVEPDIYIYGRDWNNNGIADEREDDLRPDFPYEVGQAGQHAYGQVRLPHGLEAALGWLAAEGLDSGARNDNLYARLGFARDSPDWGHVRVDHLVQRVRDDVGNPYQVFEETLSGTANFPVYARSTVTDRLEWRDSVDRQHYLEGEWRPLPGLRLWGNLRYAVNRQLSATLADRSEQAPDQLRLLTAVTKVRYEWWPAPQWQVVGQVKGLVLRRTRDSLPVDLEHQWTLMPLAKVQYRLSDRTQAWLGLEGVPGLPLRIRDRAAGRNTLDETARVLQVTNRSPYYGYDVAMEVGVRTRTRTYADPSRQAENLEETAVFLRVVMGFDE